jgi:hypothetical protein
MDDSTDIVVNEAEQQQIRAAFGRAQSFVQTEAAFAQVTTIAADGYPVVRTMTAFLEQDWSVSLVQRRLHSRIRQWGKDSRTLVSWLGSPAPGASNESPHVFDINALPPRLVSVRGDVEFMPDDWTVARYEEHVREQRSRGYVRAPHRTAEEVVRDLVGVSLRPRRVRVEGFTDGARSFTWNIGGDGRMY